MNLTTIWNGLGLIVTSGAFGLLLNYLQQRRKDKTMDPITKESAALAAADSAIEITNRTIERLDVRLRAAEDEIANSKSKFETMERAIHTMLLPYVERLRQHILDGNPPPPPDYPEGWNY